MQEREILKGVDVRGNGGMEYNSGFDMIPQE